MPKEYRKMVFSEDELKQAIAVFGNLNGSILPQDEITAVELNNTPERFVRVEYTTTAQSGASELSLSRNQVASALIAFCRDQNIPIPRSSLKNLKVDGVEVSLFLMQEG